MPYESDSSCHLWRAWLRASSRSIPATLAEAQLRLDSLTKPIGSLGRLEAIAAQMFSIFSGTYPASTAAGVYVFAADHGVTAEGVSAYPREVTAQMVRNFLAGGAAINVLARLHDVQLTVVDVGVDAEFEPAPGLCRMKVRRGSGNMLREPALTGGRPYSRYRRPAFAWQRLQKNRDKLWWPSGKWALATRHPRARLPRY